MKKVQLGSPLTLIERKFIKKEIDNNISLSEIAMNLDRGRNTIITEVRINGGRENYDPHKANNRAIENKLKRIENVSAKMKGKITNPYLSMSKRIENLEMQVEILSETIKEVLHEQNYKNN